MARTVALAASMSFALPAADSRIGFRAIIPALERIGRALSRIGLPRELQQLLIAEPRRHADGGERHCNG